MRYLLYSLIFLPLLVIAADDSAGYSKCRKSGGTAESCTAQYRPDAQRKLDQQKAVLDKNAQDARRMNERLDRQYQQQRR